MSRILHFIKTYPDDLRYDEHARIAFKPICKENFVANKYGVEEGTTSLPEFVNCPQCLENPEFELSLLRLVET